MLETEKVDIKENSIYKLNKKLLSILLKDHASNRNILWATDNYIMRGEGYYPKDNMTVKSITGRHGFVIKPRTTKSKKEQAERVKQKAEVFTPSWICNEMNNAADAGWFGRENVFNVEKDKGWKVSRKKIVFPDGMTWQDYVRLKVLEIACGEAPFLACRYDTVTGEWLDVRKRIGILDRKLRVIGENTKTGEEWYREAVAAYKSTYGFEWQGDSLLIARENMLYTFIDYYIDKFGIDPNDGYLEEIAKILSWNIWQMDGFKFVIPNSCVSVLKPQISFFDDDAKEECPGCKNNDQRKHTGIYSKIMNWDSKRSMKVINLKGATKMKFDFIIGNPPYQQSDGGAYASAKPVYNLFVEQAKKLNPYCLVMIIPSRWMTGGKGLDQFRDKMIHDRHISVLHDFADAEECFTGVDIKGGVCYFLWQRDYDGMCNIYRHDSDGVIQSCRLLAEGDESIYIRYPVLVSIKNKVASMNEKSFSTIVSSRKPYGLASDFFASPLKYGLPAVSDTKVDGGYSILGLIALNRVTKYVPEDYPFPKKEGLNKYKVFITNAYGCGEIGEGPATPVLATPVLATPGEACTETFLEVGVSDNPTESRNILSYIKTKFFRCIVGIKKQTQHATKQVYQFVPLQDFTEESDIDWNRPISEIDRQLYKKYNFDEKEIAFIESHIKEME